MILHEWLAFYSAFLNIHRSGVLTALAWLVPHETAAVSAQVLCIPYNHAPCHFMQSHIRKVYACLAVTCHLHFWQNDRGLLRATAVTWGWNGYRNKNQHRKSTLEKKILPPLQQRFEPATFQSRVRRSNHWAIPAPVLPWVLQARRQAWAGSSTLRSLAVFGGAPFRSSLFTWVLPGGRQAWTGLVPLRAWPCLMPRSSVQV